MIEFMSPEFEHLKSAYYDDFFFQHIEVINRENSSTIFASDFQGKFLQSVWDALIEFANDEPLQTIEVKKFGKVNPYTLSKSNNQLKIVSDGNEAITVELSEFYEAYYEATKYYLHFIRKENPRVVLQENYQQLSASCYYYEQNNTTKPFEADL